MMSSNLHLCAKHAVYILPADSGNAQIHNDEYPGLPYNQVFYQTCGSSGVVVSLFSLRCWCLFQ